MAQEKHPGRRGERMSGDSYIFSGLFWHLPNGVHHLAALYFVSTLSPGCSHLLEYCLMVTKQQLQLQASHLRPFLSDSSIPFSISQIGGDWERSPEIPVKIQNVSFPGSNTLSTVKSKGSEWQKLDGTRPQGVGLGHGRVKNSLQ